MIISISISDAVIHEAKKRGLPIEEFVGQLIDRGMESTTSAPALLKAIERIRRLRSMSIEPAQDGSSQNAS